MSDCNSGDGWIVYMRNDGITHASPRCEHMGALVCELGHERVDSDGEDMHVVILHKQSITCMSVR